MRGITLPPRTEDFTADPVELFFDLAYVFAFSQIVGLLIENPTWGGVGEAALLFLLLWLPWQQLTWTTNSLSGNGRGIRALLLVATVISIPMAAATSSALDVGGPVFAISLTGIMVVGFGAQLLGAKGEADLYKAVVRWVSPNILAIAALLVGVAFDGTARVLAWALALTFVFMAMVLAGRSEWLVRIQHMAERHGLIIIIALGEVIVAIGIPVVASLNELGSVPMSTVAALVAAGAFACLLWWGYFDRINPALEFAGERTEGDNARGRYVRDVFTWAHAPIVAGIIVAAAALEEIALHPTDPVPTAFLGMLVGGVGLIALGIASAIGRAFSLLARERVLGALVTVAWIVVARSLDGVVVLLGVVAILAVTLYLEHIRIER